MVSWRAVGYGVVRVGDVIGEQATWNMTAMKLILVVWRRSIRECIRQMQCERERGYQGSEEQEEMRVDWGEGVGGEWWWWWG